MGDARVDEVVLVGCGFMGQALLQGWLANGMDPETITIRDTSPGEWLRSQPQLRINKSMPESPAVIVFAVKSQLLGDVLPEFVTFGGGPTVFVSVAAGYPISGFERLLGTNTPVARAMPNLPASVGAGATALIANDATTPKQVMLAQSLFEAVGTVVRLGDESEIHAVTALSGSGPAFVFNMVEALSHAGVEHGLSHDMAMALARQTIIGAGQLLMRSGAPVEKLRQAVSSPGGTTAAGLSEFMDETTGIGPLIARTIGAARRRSEELAR